MRANSLGNQSRRENSLTPFSRFYSLAQAYPCYRDLALRQLGKIGIRDIESRIRFEHMITPGDWEDGYRIYRGATFNLAHNLRQMLHLRPRNRFEDLEAVYLVGGGTHPGSGLPVIFESARITSRLLLADMGLSTTWLDAVSHQRSEVTPREVLADVLA